VTNKTLFIGFSTSHFIGMSKDLDINKSREEAFLERKCDCFPQTDDWINKLIDIFLNKNKKIKFVVGGEKAATANKKRYKKIDYWVMGQSEISIVNLANAIKNSIPFPSIIYSNKDYHFLDFNKSKINWSSNDLLFNNEHIPIEIARGCKFDCPFCGYNKKRTGVNSIKDKKTLKEEVMYNYEKFNITSYMVMDPTPNDSIEKLEMFCNVFKSMPFPVEWSGFSRLDMFEKYPEMRDIILESGGKSIQFGIETLHDPTIKLIKKGISSSKVKELLYYLNETWANKIITGSFFIVGLPLETEKDLYKNLEWLFKKDCPLHSITFCLLSIPKYNLDIKDEFEFSQFSKNMNKFNYVNSDNSWINTNTNISKKRAFEIINNLAESHSDRRKIDFVIYSKMRNLNYTFEEIWNMPRDYKESYIESSYRKKELKNEYIQKLFNLNV